MAKRGNFESFADSDCCIAVSAVKTRMKITITDLQFRRLREILLLELWLLGKVGKSWYQLPQLTAPDSLQTFTLFRFMAIKLLGSLLFIRLL